MNPPCTDNLDNLVSSFTYNTSISWKPTQNFIKDINIIINEIIKCNIIANLDIYEILTSCRHDLTYEVEYYLSLEDFIWFKNEEGKKYFFSAITEKRYLNINEYHIIFSAFNKLIELFELQIE